MNMIADFLLRILGEQLAAYPRPRTCRLRAARSAGATGQRQAVKLIVDSFERRSIMPPCCDCSSTTPFLSFDGAIKMVSSPNVVTPATIIDICGRGYTSRFNHATDLLIAICH